MTTFKRIVVGVAIAGAFAVIVFGGWLLGWWFKAENLERRVDLINSNTGTQTAWRDEALDSVAEFFGTPEDNGAARNAIKRQACDLIGRLDDDYLDATLAEFFVSEC